jgi:hypothetical protein
VASAIADQDENTVGQRRLSLKWQGLDPSNREKERVLGKVVTNEERKCPMCGSTTWILLDGISTLQALEGGL